MSRMITIRIIGYPLVIISSQHVLDIIEKRKKTMRFCTNAFRMVSLTFFTDVLPKQTLLENPVIYASCKVFCMVSYTLQIVEHIQEHHSIFCGAFAFV